MAFKLGDAFVEFCSVGISVTVGIGPAEVLLVADKLAVGISVDLGVSEAFGVSVASGFLLSTLVAAVGVGTTAPTELVDGGAGGAGGADGAGSGSGCARGTTCFLKLRSACVTSSADNCWPTPVVPSQPPVYHLLPQVAPSSPPEQDLEAPTADARSHLVTLSFVKGAMMADLARNRER